MSAFSPWHRLEAALWQSQSLNEFSIGLDRFLVLNKNVININSDSSLVSPLKKYSTALDSSLRIANDICSGNDAFTCIIECTRKSRRRALAAITYLESLIQNGGEKPKEKPPRKATINMRMADVLQNEIEAMGWTISQWQAHLKCSRAAIAESKTWSNLTVNRAERKAELQKTKRQKTRHFSKY